VEQDEGRGASEGHGEEQQEARGRMKVLGCGHREGEESSAGPR
jgi:hypothetical protein